ncbi:MAG: hypothetical protein KatS3mg013_1744 [Actinomycetota bacterium]|nr:MAG: hypothetical protein KatS3mg013_1744 [Actinomycetota bacterium]
MLPTDPGGCEQPWARPSRRSRRCCRNAGSSSRRRSSQPAHRAGPRGLRARPRSRLRRPSGLELAERVPHLVPTVPPKRARVGAAARAPGSTGRAVLNASYNCLDRHVEAGRRRQGRLPLGGAKRRGTPGRSPTRSSCEDVCRLANALRAARRPPAATASDIYLGMVPELRRSRCSPAPGSALPTSVVFGGFSRRRAQPTGCGDARAEGPPDHQADGAWRKRGNRAPQGESPTGRCRTARRRAASSCDARIGGPRPMVAAATSGGTTSSRRPRRVPAEPLDAEHPLFILLHLGHDGRNRRASSTRRAATSSASRSRTSGSSTSTTTTSTGAPPTSAGSPGTATSSTGPCQRRDVGHVRGRARLPGQGPLLADRRAATASSLYTAPTAIRSFMKWGDGVPARTTCPRSGCSGRSASRSTPRPGSGTGAHRRRRCPIVDTWWQTETGVILITPLPGVDDAKPGRRRCPSPGSSRGGRRAGPARAARRGRLPRLTRPGRRCSAPSAATRPLRADLLESASRDVLHRRRRTRDEDGYFWLIGRIDDVINVAGHRLSTSEIE